MNDVSCVYNMYLKSTLGDDQMDIVILHLDLDHSDDDDEEF